MRSALLSSVFLLFAASASAQTNFAGGNTGTTTWTLSGSPYIVSGDVIVQAGATLTIEPGVEVRFASSDGLVSGTDTARIELIVRGTLSANGTAGQPIRFRASSGTSASTWYGIVAEATATAATLSNVQIEHTVIGVTSSLPASALALSSSSIARTTIGLRISGGAPTVSALDVSICNTGLDVQGAASPIFDGVTVRSAAVYGVQLTSSGTTALRDSLVADTATALGAAGVYVAAGTLNVTRSTVVNGYDCVYTAGTPTITITDSIVASCSDDRVDNNGGTISVTRSDVWGPTGTNFEGAATQDTVMSANPLFVGGTNYRITSNSPCRFSGTAMIDLGALPYVSDATSALVGTLWTNTTIPSGTTVVPGDLTVAPGVTLTLSPGATLQFASSDMMVAYDDPARGELRVLGTLNAVGSMALPITLTSSGGSASTWYGAVLHPSSSGSSLDGVVIDEAVIGLTHSSSAGQQIRRTTINTSTIGVRFTTSPSVADAITIATVNTGVDVQASASPTLTNLTVRSAAVYGVQATSSGTTTLTNALIADTATALGAAGVYVAAGTMVLDRTTVVNGYDCVYTAGTPTVTITDSIVSSCSDDRVDNNGGTISVTRSDVWGPTGTNFEGAATQSAVMSANPLFVGGTNYRITSNSPCRFAGAAMGDIGALPYTSDMTGALVGTLWVNTTVPSGVTVVPGDLTVAPGVTLTLSPGATLQFATSDMMVAYDDPARGELRVLGTLNAVGTMAMPITLTSAGGSASSWYGAVLHPSSSGSVLDGVVIDEAVIGLTHSSTAVQQIRRTTIRTSTIGVRFTTTPAAADQITVSTVNTGIDVQGAASPTLTRLVVRSAAVYGVQATSSGTTTLINALVADTATALGAAAVYVAAGTLAIASSTIANGYDCVYTAGTPTVTIHNSIVASCSDDRVDNNGGSISVTYSDVWGATGTNFEGAASQSNVISSNPLFAGGTDYHLMGSSVCIDAGTMTMAPSNDLDGVVRPLDGDGIGGAQVDMGAYEFLRMTFCGDGVVSSPEVCDDGSANGMYGRCNSTCTGLGPRCGDMIVNGPEACDDGNTSNTDACLVTCVAASCGDGFVRAGSEMCDDGNTSNTDACAMCMNARCGDGFTQAAVEECDDSNAVDTDACVACQNAECGDGFTQAGVEDCDDSNTINTDACVSCESARCGDGFTQNGVEQCDDGNTTNTDACAMCMNARCGDGFTGPGEACDDGNASNTDGCVMCSAARCGDGFTQAGTEQCDDANTSNTDACVMCMNARCGDGFVGPGESCDDGNTNDTDGCSNMCRDASCGDGVVQSGEECDDMNMVNDDMCSNACRNPRCGDGIRQSGEQCDDGNAANDDTCSNACMSARCGDGIVQSGEECDDSNTIGTDACTSICTIARCGDSVVQMGVEECDDGNTSNFDACVGSCVAAACGDGFIRSGVEACDDGNTMNGDGCTASCALMSCGDGVMQTGEPCDDGNASNLDECLNTCLLASCGDGFRRVGMEACDDGNGDDTDMCLTTCAAASCGDGFVQAGVEACDDGNGDDGDPCLSSCMDASCGDGFVLAGVETCDDGNDVPGDGCSASCSTEEMETDAGMPDLDSGSIDADAGIGADAGMDIMDGGCSCRASGPRGSFAWALLALALALYVRRRK